MRIVYNMNVVVTWLPFEATRSEFDIRGDIGENKLIYYIYEELRIEKFSLVIRGISFSFQIMEIS